MQCVINPYKRSCFSVLFCILSGHGNCLVPQHVKILQFLWQLALLDKSLFPHFLQILCKWHMNVCLGQVFATFLLSGMTGSKDAGQDFLACEYGILSVHLGRAHFIKIHPHSNVLILYQSTLNNKLLVCSRCNIFLPLG